MPRDQEMEWTRRRWLRWALTPGLLVGLGAVPAASWKTSRARFSPDREIKPMIQVTGDRVKVSHRINGSGTIEGTALRGARTYRFAREGNYRVEPGRYQHLVYGKVPAGGWIESVLRYR